MDLKVGDRVVCALTDCDIHLKPWGGVVTRTTLDNLLVWVKWDDGPFETTTTTDSLRRE